jgi:hypothetical protein
MKRVILTIILSTLGIFFYTSVIIGLIDDVKFLKNRVTRLEKGMENSLSIDEKIVEILQERN